MKNSSKQKKLNKLSSIVRRERKKHGLTQTELGNLAGVGINFIYHIENGKPGIRLDKLLSVLKALGLQIKLEFGKNEITE